jgi:hypothetical protein
MAINTANATYMIFRPKAGPLKDRGKTCFIAGNLIGYRLIDWSSPHADMAAHQV